jgi:hypothetical protein
MIKRLIARVHYLLSRRHRRKKLFALYCLYGDDRAVLEALGVIE